MSPTRLNRSINHGTDGRWSQVFDYCQERRFEEMRPIRLHGPVLTVESLAGIVQDLLKHVDPAPAGVVLDFTDVEELSGTWTVHFALIVHLARQLGYRVCLYGLHGQPANVAWLYRSAPEIRQLLDISDKARQKAA